MVFSGARADIDASRALRSRLARERVGTLDDNPERKCMAKPVAEIGASLWIARDERGTHVVTPAGHILSTGHTRWRSGAVSRASDQPPAEYRIRLHERLAMTTYYCPASGLLLDVAVHERDRQPEDDVKVDLESLSALVLSSDRRDKPGTAN